MDTEYFDELKETAADVKAALTHHMDNYGKPTDEDDVVCLCAVAKTAAVTQAIARRISNDYLPQHTDELYAMLIDAAGSCIVAANKVRHG